MSFAPSADAVAFLRGATFRYAGVAEPALIDINMEVRRGELVGLLGDAGSGKSTLALVLAGLAPKTTGGELVGDCHISGRFSLVTEDPGDLVTQPRVLHELQAAYEAGGATPEAAKANARAALHDAGIPEDKHDAYVWTLAQQELAHLMIAAAAARNPDLLIVDNAAGALDEEGMQALRAALTAQRKRGAALIIDHDPDRLEALTDRVVYLEKGRITDKREGYVDRAPVQTAQESVDTDDSPIKVPTLQTGQSRWWGRRDPRVKWGMFLALILLIYVAPDWRWMAAMSGLGVVMAITARPSPLWLTFALIVQIPNVLGLILLPLLGEGAATADELAFGFRLGFGWIAAILFGISVLSTMEIPEMAAGLRGVGLPRRFSFIFSYAFVLIYFSMADFTHTLRRLQAEGAEFNPRKPLRLLSSSSRLFVPIVETVARRGGSMAVALEAHQAAIPRNKRILDPFDALLVLATGALLAAAVLHRFGV